MARMRAIDRRRQLLEVAADLFARHGYHGTTTAELARAAGITEPILYRHFENKLHLFVTLVDEVGREVIESWRSALDESGDPAERLSLLLASNPATHERGQGVYRVIFQAMTGLEHDDAIVHALQQHLERLHRFIADELETLQRAGVVRTDVAASTLAWLLVDVAIGFGMVTPLGVAADDGQAGLQHVIESMLKSRG